MYLLIFQQFPLKIAVKTPTKAWDNALWDDNILRKFLFYLVSVFC